MTTYLALYAKNTAKKNKKWLDGTITANPAGSNRMRVKLSTEEGLELESDEARPDPAACLMVMLPAWPNRNRRSATSYGWMTAAGL